MQGNQVPFSFFMPHKEQDDSYSLNNALSGKNYELNSAAALITILCDGTRTLDEVLNDFSMQFNVPSEEAEAIVTEFISSLEENRQLVWRSSKVRKVAVPPPNYIILEITNKCNLKCIHCSVRANERKNKELTTQEWKNLITALAKMGVEAVGLSGGEPLIREDVFEIAEHAIKLGLLVGMPTNGLLFNDENMQQIKRLGIDIQLSIDGSKPEYHDKIRGQPGCFDTLMKKIGLLQKYEVPFTVAAVATALNYHDIPDLVKLSERIGARSLRVQPFFPVGRGREYRDELDLDAKMTRHVTESLLKAAETAKIEVGGFYFQFALDSDPPTTIQPCEDGACSAGYNFAGITEDGRMYPCSHIWQLAEDNIREKPIQWIWENSRIFNFFRSLRREDCAEECQICPYFAKCRGGCKAMNILDGRFQEPDKHCWLVA